MDEDNGSIDSRQEGEGQQQQQQQHGEQNDGGHSGEGAASALAHMKSQNKQHRALTGDADDAAGGSGSHGQ